MLNEWKQWDDFPHDLHLYMYVTHITVTSLLDSCKSPSQYPHYSDWPVRYHQKFLQCHTYLTPVAHTLAWPTSVNADNFLDKGTIYSSNGWRSDVVTKSTRLNMKKLWIYTPPSLTPAIHLYGDFANNGWWQWSSTTPLSLPLKLFWPSIAIE